MRLAFRTSLAVATVLASTTAAHAESSPQDRAAAQSFFDRAMSLMKDSKFPDACPLLEESQRLDPAQGTQFQLARCYESEGRVASAWIQYVDVADAAKAGGNAEREKVARQHADAVAPRVPKLVIEVATTNGEGVEVKRDGVVLRKIQWGMAVPVDPGKHAVTASATGRAPFETQVDVKEGGSAKVTVPELAKAAAVPPPTPIASAAPPPPAAPRSSTQRTIGLVVGGVGVAAFGASIFIALAAKSKAGDTGANCVADRCNQAGLDTRSDAVKLGTTATIVGTVGLLAVAGGATLWLTAPKPGETASLGLTPMLGGVAARGAF